MSKFSQDMRKLATQLCKELGNTCTMTKVTQGGYDPLTGNNGSTTKDFNLYSAPESSFQVNFGSNGQGTNFNAFRQERVIVPWFGEMIDSSWLYNGNNILEVSEEMSDDEIIIWYLTVGEAR